MKKYLQLFVMIVPVLSLLGNPAKDRQQDVLLIEVDGIVCNFCAYGIERWLSKLPYVDDSKYGGDGVLVDIETSLVNVAIKGGGKIAFKDLKHAVTQAGYPAKAVYLKVKGKLQGKSMPYSLRSEYLGQEFSVTGKNLDSFRGKIITATLTVGATALSNHSGKKPVSAKVSTIGEAN